MNDLYIIGALVGFGMSLVGRYMPFFSGLIINYALWYGVASLCGALH